MHVVNAQFIPLPDVHAYYASYSWLLKHIVFKIEAVRNMTEVESRYKSYIQTQKSSTDEDS